VITQWECYKNQGMKKFKGYLLVLIILVLPSAIYIGLTTGKHNFIHLPIVGPQTDSSFHQIPNFSFVNQNGDTITQEDYLGNVYVANFIFTTCPTICPVMTHQMRRIQQKTATLPGFKGNFKILSHTVNPQYDTPEILLEYSTNMEADLSNWDFVTGHKDSIYAMAPYYFVNAMEDSLAEGGFLHSEFFVIVDKQGRIRARDDDEGNNIGVYDGTSEYEVGLLIDDLKILIAEYNSAKKDKSEQKR
jgi:protein SCO1/2